MPITEKKKASNARWDTANLKRLSLAMRTEDFQRMREHLDATRETTNGFINRAIEETIENDKSHQKP